jgi:hypothetical protein
MTVKSDLKKIATLANKKGKPLIKIDRAGKVVSFVYSESFARTKSYWYPNMTKGIQGELKRLA